MLHTTIIKKRNFTLDLYQSLLEKTRWEDVTDFEVYQHRKKNQQNLMRGLTHLAVAAEHNFPTFIGTLYAKKIVAKEDRFIPELTEIVKFASQNLGIWNKDMLRFVELNCDVTDFGLISTRVVTTAGANFLVDCMQGITEPETMRYHGIGTGNTAEAVGDTGLVTESTTALNPDSTRATGTLAEGGTANVFRSVGTVSVDASIACVEHGLFSQAATGGGTLLDRSVFAAVNLVSGNAFQTTYDFTITAGS